MNFWKKCLLLILIGIVIISSFPILIATASETPQNNTISDSLKTSQSLLNKFKESFRSPDLEPIYAYAKAQYDTQYLAYDQDLIALDYLSLAQEAQNASLISLRDQFLSDAMATIKFMTTYLVNSRIRDKNGIIEFWDTSLLDQGLTRVSKLARDQALALLAIDKLLTFFDNGYPVESSTYSYYNQSFSNIWSFLSSLYDTTNGGWYTKTTPVNESTFTIDTTKRTADNMIIISSLSQINHITWLQEGFTKAKLETILSKSMDFFLNHFLILNHGIAAFGSADGSFVSTYAFFAKENALFGLANLNLYKLTGNQSYVNYAKNIWTYLKNTFWDSSFGGLYMGITSLGDPFITSKSIEDQIFYTELSLRLASLNPAQTIYMDDYLRTAVLINHNFIQGVNIASSTDPKFNPSSEYYTRSAAYYVNLLVGLPHISAIFVSKSIIIGEKLPLKIYISNMENIKLNISLVSSNYFSAMSLTPNSSSINLDLTLNNDVQTGNENIYFNLSISRTLIQQLSISTNLNPNVRIPNGLIYLLGAAVLATIVVIVRRPPEFIKKYIQEIKAESNSSTGSQLVEPEENH